jgi:hypothetical protein
MIGRSLPMTRAELIANLAERLPDLPAREVESAVRPRLDLLMETMAIPGASKKNGLDSEGAFLKVFY